MSLFAALLTRQAKVARSTIDPMGGEGFDGGGPEGSPQMSAPMAPVAPMAPAPRPPTPVVPKNTPSTPPQPKSPGLKAGALSRAVTKTAILGMDRVGDFARGASSAAEELLRKNLTPRPDGYVTSLQTQMPDHTQVMPNRGTDIHAAALSALG